MTTLTQEMPAFHFARWLNEMSESGWDFEESRPVGNQAAVIFSRIGRTQPAPNPPASTGIAGEAMVTGSASPILGKLPAFQAK